MPAEQKHKSSFRPPARCVFHAVAVVVTDLKVKFGKARSLLDPLHRCIFKGNPNPEGYTSSLLIQYPRLFGYIKCDQVISVCLYLLVNPLGQYCCSPWLDNNLLRRQKTATFVIKICIQLSGFRSVNSFHMSSSTYLSRVGK